MTMSIPLSGGACLLSVFVSLPVSFVWGYISSSALCLCLCPVYRDFLCVCFCLLFQLSLSFFFSYSLSSLSLSLMCTHPLSLFSCIGSCSLLPAPPSPSPRLGASAQPCPADLHGSHLGEGRGFRSSQTMRGPRDPLTLGRPWPSSPRTLFFY